MKAYKETIDDCFCIYLPVLHNYRLNKQPQNFNLSLLKGKEVPCSQVTQKMYRLVCKIKYVQLCRKLEQITNVYRNCFREANQQFSKENLKVQVFDLKRKVNEYINQYLTVRNALFSRDYIKDNAQSCQKHS